MQAGYTTATVASTVAVSALIGASVSYGVEVISAAVDSNSAEDFAQKGNWGTVAVTAGSAFAFGAEGFVNAKTAEKNQIPQDAKDTYKYVSEHGGATQPGYRGGRIFANDGRGGSAKLPSKYGPFKEYDIHPYIRGINRGAERIVTGSGKAAWYTPNHYKTFIRMDK